jgi:PAS domain S-box-containing protein
MHKATKFLHDRLLFFPLAILLCIACVFATSTGNASSSPAGNDTAVHAQATAKRVFILNSFNREYTWTQNMLRGIDDAFSRSGFPIETYTYFMDMKRIPRTQDYFFLLRNNIAFAYKTLRFDAIFACDNDALDFLRDFRDTLFPGTPVVFSSINNFDPAMLAGRNDITGTSENTDYKGTIELALSLFPKTKTIFVLSDKTTTGLAHVLAVKKVEALFSGKASFEYLSFGDYTLEEMGNRLGSLDKNSLVLLLHHFRDKNQTSYSVEQSTPFLTSHSSAPCFALSDIRVGVGALGGHVVSGYHHGEAAANMVVSILSGTDVRIIPVMLKSPNKYMFDSPVLNRFHISENSLPRESIVLNKPDSFFKKYRMFIFSVGAIVMALILFVVLMGFEIFRRRSVESSLRESRQQLKVITDHTPDHVLMQDKNLRYTLVINPQLGLTAEDMIGKTDHEFLSKDDAGSLTKIKSRVLESGNAAHLEVPLVDKYGKTQYFDGSYIPKTGVDGTIDGIIGYFRNVTERKQAEETLKESEERFRVLFEGSRDALMTLGPPDWKYTSSNRATLDLFGAKNLAEFTSFRLWDLSPEKQPDGRFSKEKAGEMINTAMRLGTHFFEWTHNRVDGTVFIATILLTKIHLLGSKILQATVRDISEQKHTNNLILMQRDLGHSLGNATSLEQGLRLCLESAIKASELDCGGIYLRDPTTGALDLVFHRGLPASFIEKALHFDVDSANTLLVMAGKPVFTEHLQLHLPIDEERQGENLRAIGIIPIVFEERVIGCLNVASHVLDVVPEFARNSLESIAAHIGNSIVRLRTEESLRENEERFRSIIQNSYAGYFFIDKNGIIKDVNDAWVKLYKYDSRDEIIGRHFTVIQKLDDLEAAQKTVDGILIGDKKFLTGEFSRKCKDGAIGFHSFSARPVFMSGEVAGIEGFIIDITERKAAEEALQRTQKLDSLGTLAGGIAHDFNNLLSGIFGYIDLARIESSDPAVTNYLTKTFPVMDRARGLTRQLLTFAKGGAPERKTLQIQEFLKETAQFALSGSNVSSNFHVPENLWPCNIDKNQIGQVIDNIVINAQQAMPLGGELNISAENIHLAENENPTFAGGNYVRLSFADSGVGIPADILPRIFDPFFTTKAKGHGLGLATCFSIVKRHDGFLEAISKPGKGATFFVYLPATNDLDSSASPLPEISHKGIGSVLIMDDEEVVRDILGAMLKKLGYSVESATNGTDTLALVSQRKKNGLSFAAIILDLTIRGGLGGRETVAELRRMGVTEPIFVASGYSEDPVMARPQDFGFTAAIKKPFTKAELSGALGKFLNKS